MTRKDQFSITLWNVNEQVVKQYQRNKGVKKVEAINHLLRIATLALNDREFVQRAKIDGMTEQERETLAKFMKGMLDDPRISVETSDNNNTNNTNNKKSKDNGLDNLWKNNGSE